MTMRRQSCKTCQGPLPEKRRPGVPYCSPKCAPASRRENRKPETRRKPAARKPPARRAAPTRKALRVRCGNPDCAALVTRWVREGQEASPAYCSRRCVARKPAEASAMYRGGSERGRGPRWKQLAAAIRERDGYRCRRCGAPAEHGPVDHLIPWRMWQLRHLEGSPEANDKRNLALLCLDCHGVKTSTVERRYVQRGDAVGLGQFLRDCGAGELVGLL